MFSVICADCEKSESWLVSEFRAVPDTCLMENGGCEHYCDEEEGGGRLNCSCADGYFLGVDGRSCIAKGERTL